MTTQHATDTNFAALTNTGKPVLVDFHATWCGPCRKLAPIVDAIANEHPEYTVVKVDIDEAPQTALAYNIMGVPTLLVLNADGTPASQTTGPKPKNAILKDLANTN